MFVERGYFLDADSGGAEGGGDTSTGEGKEPGVTPPQSPAQEPKQDGIKLTPTQLKERLERAEASAQAKLLKEFGYEDPAALKQFIEAGKAAMDAQKTDTERQQEALRVAQEKADQLEARTKQAEAQAQAAILQAEALALMAGKFANPKAAIKLLDMTSVKIQDGTVTGLDVAVEKLAKDEPWTLAKPDLKTPPAKFTTNPKDGGDQTKETDEDKRRRYFGSIGGGEFFQKSPGGVRIKSS